MKYKKALIVAHREESLDDFREIGRRIHKLDPSIAVAMLTNGVDSRHLPPGFLDLPLLVVYLVNPPPTPFERAAKLAVRWMDKIEEFHHFQQNGIPCLPIEPFAWGMEPDPAVYSDLVVLKPANITSTTRDVNMLPTRLVAQLKPSDFPAEHLIHQDSYLIQKFIKCGERPIHYRVLVFLDEILYSSRSQHRLPYPDPSADLHTLLNTSVVASWRGLRDIALVKEPEILQLAKDVASTFPENPLLGVDIIRDTETGQLYVLEVNAGGNTWHFSSDIGRGLRQDIGGRNAMIRQFNAWDRAAEALVRKTQALAS